MKILKLSSYCEPEQISSSHLSKDLEEAYMKAGFTIENFVPTPTRGVNDEVRAEYKKKKYEEKNDGKIIIHRFSMFREGKNPLQRAFRYVLVNIIQYYKGIHAKDIDLVYAGSTPPTQGVLCALVSKKLSKKYKKKVPFIYNLQDVFPDSLVNTGMTKKGSLIWRIGRKIEDYTYRSADKIIVVSSDVKDNILKKGVPEDKVMVIPNWINTNRIKHIEREDNAIFDEFGLDRNKFYVTYAGNLGAAQGIDVLVDVAELVADTDIQFVIFGNGVKEAEIRERSEKLANLSVFNMLPPERVSEVYSLGNISFVGCKAGFGGASVPSKTWSIMATSTPILLSFDKDSALYNLIKDNECGFCCEPGNKEALKEAVLCAYNSPSRLLEMGMNGRRIVEENYSAEHCTNAIINLQKSVLHS